MSEVQDDGFVMRIRSCVRTWKPTASVRTGEGSGRGKGEEAHPVLSLTRANSSRSTAGLHSMSKHAAPARSSHITQTCVGEREVWVGLAWAWWVWCGIGVLAVESVWSVVWWYVCVVYGVVCGA